MAGSEFLLNEMATKSRLKRAEENGSLRRFHHDLFHLLSNFPLKATCYRGSICSDRGFKKLGAFPAAAQETLVFYVLPAGIIVFFI